MISTADTALGIRAAARALELDFVPLALEQYELVSFPRSSMSQNCSNRCLLYLKMRGLGRPWLLCLDTT